MPSKIEWTDAVWNPTTGCTKVSPGCAHCYAESLTKRYAGRPGFPAEFKPWTPANAAENVVLHPDRLEAPFSWKTPRMVFVDSMSDLFHENIPDEYIDRCFRVMQLARRHTFQVLTKRPERMRDFLTNRVSVPIMTGSFGVTKGCGDNIWLGVTVENQRWADERIPILLDTPAAVRFLSCEPLLGPVDLSGEYYDTAEMAYLGTEEAYRNGYFPEKPAPTLGGEYGLNWVIVGGESGPRHRPFDHDWARSIVAQCRDAKVACFVKQLGGARPGNKLEDLPEDLRVREFPR